MIKLGINPILIVAIVILSLANSIVYSETSLDDKCYMHKIYIPAVSERGFGEAVETNIIAVRDGGEIHIVGVSSVGLDTLLSLLVAYTYSYNLNTSYFKNHSIYIILPSGTTSVKGPSAGALLYFVFASMALKNYVPINVSGTGALNLDGTVENVGGVPEKIRALESIGVIKSIFIPSSTAIYYERSLSRYNMNISSVSSITDLAKIYGVYKDINRTYVKLYPEKIYADYTRNLSIKISEHEMKLLNLYIYAKKIASSKNIYFSYDTQLLENIYMDLPKNNTYSYARINILFLLIINSYRELLTRLYYVDKDLYNELVNNLVNEIESSRSLLHRFVLEDRKVLKPDLIILYIIFIKRSLDLIDLYEKNNGFREDIINISDLVYAYARSLSLDYWYDLIDEYTNYYKNSSLFSNDHWIRDLYMLKETIVKIYKILNISYMLGEGNTLFYKILSFTLIDPSELSEYNRLFTKLIIDLVVLENLIENYSYNLRSSSIITTYLSSGAEGLKKLFNYYNYFASAENFISIFSPIFLWNMFTYSKYIFLSYDLANTTIYSSAIRVLAEIESLIFIIMLLLHPEKIPNIYIETKLSLETLNCLGTQKISGNLPQIPSSLGLLKSAKNWINLSLIFVVIIGSLFMFILSRNLIRKNN
ncbi:MAG: S16 family serine protease [Sulfolobales archaeon]